MSQFSVREQHIAEQVHPLSTLLSQALVAFIIEFDNEFEHQMPHRTTRHDSTAESHHAPWLVSMVMWIHFMQFVLDDGIPVHELQGLMRTTEKSMRTWLTRMGKWWGYIFIEDGVVYPTRAGRQAQKIWQPLTGVIEKRWRERSGNYEIDQVQESLWTVVSQLDAGLPDALPILGYGLFTQEPHPENRDGNLILKTETGSERPTLPALLSKALLSFALEFESASDLSLATCANILRILDDQGIRVKDLPFLSGVSKEAVNMATNMLQERDLVNVDLDPAGSRFKVIRLTLNGAQAREAYFQRLGIIEQRWKTRFGKDAIRALRESLERLVGDPTMQRSPLFRGLEPYPDVWRALIRRPDTLPHYPMILHRGGFPDGS